MNHDKIEKNVGLMGILIILVVSIGGLVEIVPLFFQSEVRNAAPGIEPYDPLELAGRDVYIREGCYGCHSQMIRPFRAETERYGHYSLAGESVYEHPFLWGSKRTGPDLARVGKRYSDEWHREHLIDPRAVVPESNMPGFPWLAENVLDGEDTAAKMRALRSVGVPYTDAMIANADDDLRIQTDPDADGIDAFMARYPKAVVRNFDANPALLSEMDALVAYLQMLGTLADVQPFDAKKNPR